MTLPYDPKFVPLSASLLPTLDKGDVQRYLKRLRKICKGDNIRYFICGEYGTRTYRPHYHGIFFNVSDRENFSKAWAKYNKSFGHVHIGDTIDNGAVPYTLKYMYKKGLIPAFEGDDRLPEFRIMSNNIGSNYLTQNMINWHLADFKNRQYAQFRNGVKIPLPRYYREKLLDLAQQDDWINNRPIRTKAYFRPEETEKEDYRTVRSQVENTKTRQRLFEKSHNQQNRKTI